MRKYYLLPLMLFIIAGTAITADAGYHGKKGQWNWWENKDVRGQLELTEDQETKIDAIAKDFEPRLEAANKTSIEKRKLFKDTMHNAEASNADIIKAFDVMWDAKYKQKRVGLDMKLGIRDVITPEQRAKLYEIKKDWHENQKKQMKDKMIKIREMKESETTQ